VVSCCFSSSLTFVISCDDKNVLKIWDIQERNCIQSILTDSPNGPLLRVIGLPFKDNFLVTNKAVYHYNNTQHLAKNQFKRRTNRALKASFNSYFNTLVITTDYDLRVFNCYTGKLEKVFVDQRIVEGEHDRINGYHEGALQRKYYIGDPKGNIDCFNFANGEKLKAVNDLEQDQQDIKKFSGLRSSPDILSSKRSENKQKIPLEDQITAMIYLTTENRLIVGTHASIIKIYDESSSDSSRLCGVATE